MGKGCEAETCNALKAGAFAENLPVEFRDLHLGRKKIYYSVAGRHAKFRSLGLTKS